MRVSLITPWGADTRGGLRTYSEHLVEGFREAGDPIAVDVTRLARFHDVDGRYLEWLVERACRNDPDVLHVQHEGQRYGYAENALFDAVPDGVRTAVTVHSAQGLEERQRVTLVERADKVIVHNERELSALEPYPKETPVVIPHGAVLRDPPSKPASAAALDLDHIPDFAVVTYGFLGPWKQVEHVIDAVHHVAGTYHVHAGEWHTSLPHGGYAARMKRYAGERIPTRHQWPGYVADEDLDAVFGLADLAVYANAWASESGSMHEMLGAGVPVLARDVAPYDDDRPVELFDGADELETTLRDLRDDADRRDDLAAAGRAWAEGRTWELVARWHRQVYDWLVDVTDPDRYLPGEVMRWEATWAGFDGEYPDLLDLHQATTMGFEYICGRLGAANTVLDVGCSTGRLPAYASGRFSAPREWHGVDVLADHVEAARESGRYERVERATADALPFGDDRFEAVVLSEVLEHCPNQRAVLAEAGRVCAPDGVVVVVMPSAERSSLTDPWTANPSALRETATDAGLDVLECTLLAGANAQREMIYKTVGAFAPADRETVAAEGTVPDDVAEAAEEVGRALAGGESA